MHAATNRHIFKCLFLKISSFIFRRRRSTPSECPLESILFQFISPHLIINVSVTLSLAHSTGTRPTNNIFPTHNFGFDELLLLALLDYCAGI